MGLGRVRSHTVQHRHRARTPAAGSVYRLNRASSGAPIVVQRRRLTKASVGPQTEAILSPTGDHASGTFHATVSSHLTVTGTASRPKPSNDIPSARRENQCCFITLPNAID